LSTLKKLFPASYDPSFYNVSPRQLAGYRRWCTFALDANVLLGLYTYSAQTRKDFLQILEDLKDKIWLPHQAAYEYEKNRTSRIEFQTTSSEKIRKLLSTICEEFEQKAYKNGKLLRVEQQIRHPFLSIDAIKCRFASVIDEINKKLEAAEENYKASLVNDPVRERLNWITCNRIGDPFSQSELEKIYDDGARRYERLQPPGYKDSGGKHAKEGVEKYGDLILWRQLINRGRETGRSVYFITDDIKKDWWRIEHGHHLGPRQELVEEMTEHAFVRFLISDSADFYTWAGKYVHRKMRDEAIAEARRSVAPSLPIHDTIKSIYESLASAGQYLAAMAPSAELLAAMPPSSAELLAAMPPSAGDLARAYLAPLITAMESFRSWITLLSPSASVEKEGNAIEEDDARRDVKSDQVNVVSDDQMTEYRKKKGSDTWHWCKNCSNWPESNYDVQHVKPTDDKLDNQCKAKDKKGTCEK